MSLSSYIKNIRQKGRSVFTVQELMAELHVSRNAALNAISRLCAHGELITPTKSLYVIVPPEYQPQGCIPPEELVPILMNHLKADYYVSLLSGARYHGATHQRPGCFQIVSKKRIKHSLTFGEVKLDLIYKNSLDGLPIQETAVKTGYLKVATPELIALDLLSYPNHSGGLNHIATVLSELVEVIDSDKLIKLAEFVGEKAWLQRLGFILEHIDTMDEENKLLIIDRLQEHLEGKMKAFIPLASEISRVGYPRLKKWMIIENTDIESDL